MKRCPRCRETKPLKEFNKNKYAKSGYQSACRSCKSTEFAKWHARVDTPERRKAKVAATANWRKRNPDKRRSNDIRREAAKKSNGASEKVDRLCIYERDAYICWICQMPTMPHSEHWNLRPSLDHVIALMDGGSHTYDNLRCAHRRCNTIRGVRRYSERKRAGLPDMPMPDPAARMAPKPVKPPPKDPLRRKPGATHCRNGHELTEANTIHVDGRRRCRICEYARTNKRRRAQAALRRKQALSEQEPQ